MLVDVKNDGIIKKPSSITHKEAAGFGAEQSGARLLDSEGRRESGARAAKLSWPHWATSWEGLTCLTMLSLGR